MRDFYSAVHEAVSLNGDDQDKILHDLIETWKHKAPVVADVLAGRDSFEQIVKPLVEQNLRIRFPCSRKAARSPEEFRREAENITKRLDDVIPLDWWFVGPFPHYDLMTSPLVFPKFQFYMFLLYPLLLALGAFALGYHNGVFAFGMLLTCLKWGALVSLTLTSMQLVASAWMYFSIRRSLARQVQTKAQFLDRTLRQACQG
ncbi:MAG: hypothetical protein WC641_02015 [Patescibacteria group bacterium]